MRRVFLTGLFLCLLGVLPAAAQQSGVEFHLKKLAALPGVAGNEELVSGYIAEKLRGMDVRGGKLEIEVDNLGNVIARIGVGSPHRLIVTPIDEPGYFVSGITDDGFLRLQSLPQFGLNPWFHLLHTNQPVQVLSRNGQRINGVFAGLSTHLQGRRPNPEDLIVDHLDEVYVDIGAKSAAEARMAGANILDPVTLDKEAYSLANDGVTAPFIGSRTGVAILLNLLQRMDASKLQGTLTVAFVTRSNMGNQGLARMLNRFEADEVILVQPLRGSNAKPGDGVQVAAFRGEDGENVQLRDKLIALSSNAHPGPSQRIPGVRYFGPAKLPTRSAMLGVPVKFPQTPAAIVSRADLEIGPKLLATWLGTSLNGQPYNGISVRLDFLAVPPGKKESIEYILASLISAYGVSGFEAPVAERIQGPMPEWARDIATVDEMGNVITTFGRKSDKPDLLFVAHMDEIGWVVDEVMADGRLKLSRRGGLREEYFLGHALFIHTGNNFPVSTVMELPDDYRTEPYKRTRRGYGYIAYTGARNAEEVAALGIEVGQSVTVPKRYRELAGKRVSGRSCDDRCGSSALLAALWQINPKKVDREVTFVWAVEEEIGLNGAKHVARRLHEQNAVPEFVFAVDTLVSSDSPLESKRYAYAELGKGFVMRAIDLSNVTPRKYVDRVVYLARQNRIPVQTGTMNGGNDGAAFVPFGSVNIPIAWPLRYSHSAGEVLDLGDLQALADIIPVIITDF